MLVLPVRCEAQLQCWRGIISAGRGEWSSVVTVRDSGMFHCKVHQLARGRESLPSGGVLPFV